jgi:hypothetical protein
VGSKPAGQSVSQNEAQAENVIINVVVKSCRRSVLFPSLEEFDGDARWPWCPEWEMTCEVTNLRWRLQASKKVGVGVRGD